MPRPKATETRVLDTLTRLFRDHGFEGASLTRISEATGLKRASLYHRFPGGKEEMALAVLRHVHGCFADEILAPLSGDESPANRVRGAARRIDEFYEGGRRACLLDTLSLGTPSKDVRDAIRESFEAVSRAFASAARAAGKSPATAKRLGQEALMRLEGALVVARATGDTQPFRRLIKDLPRLLTA